MTPRWRKAVMPLKSGIYVAQVVHAASTTSHTGAKIIKLRLTVLPWMRYQPDQLTHYLIFSPESDWTVGQFFASIGVNLPDGTCVSVTPPYCLRCVIYPEIVARLHPKVGRLLSREEALDKNPELVAVRLPGNQPEGALPPILSKTI